MGCETRAKATCVVVVVLSVVMFLGPPSAAYLVRRALSSSPAALDDESDPADAQQGQRCRMYCQSGFYLQVHADGAVNGTRDADSRYGLLQMLRVTVKLVSIRGVVASSYLCMNRKGKVYTSEKRSSECVFVEELLETSYYVYSSKKYSRRRKKMYIAINRRGRPKRGRRKNQGCTQFHVRHVDDAEWTDVVAQSQSQESAPQHSQQQHDADDSLEDNGQQDWGDD